MNYDFKKLIKDEKHHLNALIGQEYVIAKNNKITNTSHGFPSTFTADDCINLMTQGTPFEITNYSDPNDVLLSYFGRLNYDYDSKYLFSGTFRADGSSKFARGNRWGYFPSAALAWRVSSEPFMESTHNWLDDLKLRFSYGTAGNNNIPSGQLNQEYEAMSATFTIKSPLAIFYASLIVKIPSSTVRTHDFFVTVSTIVLRPFTMP